MAKENLILLQGIKKYTLFTLLIILLGGLFYNEILVSNPTPEYKDFSKKELINTQKDLEVEKKNTNLSKPIVKLIIIADSHLNSNSYNKLKELLKGYKDLDLIVHLGDHTDFGDILALQAAKSELDNLGISYVALPGDRDLAASSSEENFYKTFQNITSLNLKNIRLTFFNNSRNFLPYKDSYIADFIMKFDNTDFLFTSQPIYVDKGNFFAQKYMGSIEAFPDISDLNKINLEKYSSQRDLVLSSIRKSNIRLVTSGDHHRSAEYQDPINTKINYHIVGATAEKIQFGNMSIKQESLQPQRVSLIEIGADKEYKITELLLNEK